MGNKAIKLEFDDDEGGRYSLKVSGKINREKIIKLVDLYELINISSESKSNTTTSYEKLRSLLKESFTLKYFTSKDIQTAYEDKYQNTMKLSIVATYLRRLVDEGTILRYKRGRTWAYSFQKTPHKLSPIPQKRTNYKKHYYK